MVRRARRQPLIAELEMSKKYEVGEGSPCDGGHSCPIEGEPNID